MTALPEKSKNFLTPEIWWLSFASFLNDTASEIIYPLIPIFLTTVLKSSIAFVGLVEGLAESTASILKLFSGIISDKIKKRKVLAAWGYTLSNVFRSLFFLVTSPIQVLLIRFIDRIGKGIRTAPRDALLVENARPEERGRVFGFNRAMDNAGAVAGPIIAFLVLYFFAQNLRLTFMISAIPAALVVLIFWFKVKEKTSKDFLKKEPLALKTLFNLKDYDARFKIFLLLILLFTLSNSSDAFLILHAKNTGIPLTLIPVLWLVFHFSKAIFNLPAGILSDKIGRSKTLFAGWLIYALVYWGFGLAQSSGAIWILFIIYGLYFGLTEGAERALIADLVPSEKLGTAYGIYNFNIGLMALPASVLTGLLWQKFGVLAAFGFDGCLAFLAAVLVLILIKK